MKNMQWPASKNIHFLLAIFFLSAAPALSQTSNYRLQTADSLFNAKQYTQSLDHYKKIFQQNQFSPAMLMKMAFIEEGLNHVGPAMYYLNLYYLYTADEEALIKMQQLSEKYKLAGYESPDFELAFSFYRQYRMYISLTLAAILLFFFSLTVYLKRRHKSPLVPFIFVLLFAIVLLAHLRVSEGDVKAIVSKGNTLVMEGPSGAAPVVQVISPGHRLTVHRKKDVWLEVEWDGKIAYVKENNLLTVSAL